MESQHSFNKDFYLPKLEKVLATIKDKYIESKYPFAIFFPYTFGNYFNMKRKIFYMGRDPYGWIWKENMFNNPSKYLDEYMDLDTYEKKPVLDSDGFETGIVNINRLLFWKKQHRNPGVFWGLIPKLHYYLQTGKKDLDLSKLTEEEKSIIEGIGYSNFYSIEVPESLKNPYDNWWSEIDKNAYYELKKECEKQIDPLRNLLDAYPIDYLIIFSWEDNISNFRGDLDLKKIYSFDNTVEAYSINGYDTKIIWTSHPRALHRQSCNNESIMNLINDTIVKIEG